MSSPSPAEDAPFLCRGCGTPRFPKGKLKKRKGKFGEFYGCTRFPNCKHTEQLSYRGPRWPMVGPLAVPRGGGAGAGADGASGRPTDRSIMSRSPQAPAPRPSAAVPPTSTSKIHGFGPDPASTSRSGGKASILTPFQGGEVRTGRRAPSPPQPAKKRRIVDGRVVVDEPASGQQQPHWRATEEESTMPTPQERAPQRRRPNDPGYTMASPGVAASASAPSSASDAARAAALARLEAVTPTPGKLAKKRRAAAAAATAAAATGEAAAAAVQTAAVASAESAEQTGAAGDSSGGWLKLAPARQALDTLMLETSRQQADSQQSESSDLALALGTARASLKCLSAVLRNIVKAPTEQKYRTLRLTNARITCVTL